jgi:hypothetical protein
MPRPIFATLTRSARQSPNIPRYHGKIVRKMSSADYDSLHHAGGKGFILAFPSPCPLSDERKLRSPGPPKHWGFLVPTCPGLINLRQGPFTQR